MIYKVAMDHHERAKLIETFLLENQNKIGDEIKIYSSLSTNKLNFDRHFVTNTLMRFKLEDLRWRFSGFRIFFSDNDNMFEISIDRIIEINKNSDKQYVILEKYSEEIYRKTEIEFFKN